MMKFYDLALSIRIPWYIRWLFGLLLVAGLVACLNVSVMHRFTYRTFGAFVLPFLLVFSIWFLLVNAVPALHWWRGWMFVPIAVAIVYVSILWVSWYYYDFLPARGIRFFNTLTDGNRLYFTHKVILHDLILLIMVVGEWGVRKYLLLRLQIQALTEKLLVHQKSWLLSAHFIRQILDQVNDNRQYRNRRSYEFLYYVHRMVTRQDVLVPLGDEWRYVKVFIDLFPQYHIHIQGEQMLDKSTLNRSIPALAILTWLENALKYGAKSAEKPIVLEWGRDHLQRIYLRIANHVGKVIRSGSGRGMALVQHLFDQLLPGQYTIGHRVEAGDVFVLLMTVNSRENAKI